GYGGPGRGGGYNHLAVVDTAGPPSPAAMAVAATVDHPQEGHHREAMPAGDANKPADYNNYGYGGYHQSTGMVTITEAVENGGSANYGGTGDANYGGSAGTELSEAGGTYGGDMSGGYTAQQPGGYTQPDSQGGYGGGQMTGGYGRGSASNSSGFHPYRR
ncbi:hypothetical protein Bbelb_420000, partial [Branchiostoma belcheri]